MVGKYVQTGDDRNARLRMEIVYNLYDPEGNNHFALMFEGDGLYKLGFEDEAYQVFAKIFALFGKNGFKGESAQYLNFYMNRKQNKDS